ncbi:aquaporin [Deinococcus taeanensis]|uniref:MIP/aquaporin family protein n=1 Tax=Deinococcus taeanensis TaxID=2737050 RepID=UPI001CDD5185|nr:aquaporin [Deinococcus taeanensis]UBV43840.1 aquaporin [Deinococcus taeanensis]
MSGPASRPHHTPPPLGRALAAEALGTFVLTAARTGAARLAETGLLPEPAAHALPPGLVILTLIFTLGDVSGAHFNPAVTLAFALRRAFLWARALPYLAAQVGGAVLAAALLTTFMPLPTPTERLPAGGAALLEIACTCLLVTVVLSTAHRNDTLKPVMGMIVGSTVALDHFVSHPVAAVSMNPARSFGPALLAGHLSGSWPHLLAPLGGALLAVGLVTLLRGRANTQECEAAQGKASSA